MYDGKKEIASIACVPDKDANLTILTLCVLSLYQGKSIGFENLK